MALFLPSPASRALPRPVDATARRAMARLRRWQLLLFTVKIGAIAVLAYVVLTTVRGW